MYDFEEIIYHNCVICNQRTEWSDEVCYPCMEYFEELAYGFCGVEGLDEDDFYEAEEKYNEEKYNEEDYSIFMKEKERIQYNE